MAVFVAFCLLQIPLYVVLGRDCLIYDASMKSAEANLSKLGSSRGPEEPASYEAVRTALKESEQALFAMGGKDSRQARLDLNRAMLAWNEGKTRDADRLFARAVRGFEMTHGPDSFHANAIRLRYAEFLMLNYRYQEALALFERGVKPVEDTLGPKDPFAVRMVFRHVCLLVNMGRPEQALGLARDYLPALLENAGRFDEPYLTQVASCLDALSRLQPALGRPLPPPPGGQAWRPALLRAFEEGQKRLAETADDSGG